VTGCAVFLLSKLFFVSYYYYEIEVFYDLKSISVFWSFKNSFFKFSVSGSYYYTPNGSVKWSPSSSESFSIGSCLELLEKTRPWEIEDFT
jgi:hypothetical protein